MYLLTLYCKRLVLRRINQKIQKSLPGGESNPGLSRDRQGYSPLYYRGLKWIFNVLIFDLGDESVKR